MATKTGTITARPTKYGAKSSTNITGEADFCSGTGDLLNKKTTAYYINLYGMNFSALADLKNVKITGFKISVSAKNYSYSSAGYARVWLATDFTISGTTVTYTDVGGGYDNTSWSTSERDKYYVKDYDVSSYPDFLEWANSNIDKIVNGFTTNSFGLRVGLRYIYVNDITLTLTYTYEEAETGINNILIGTAKPSKILLGTQEVKEVYIDKTKVFG
jgi:hypothetical protein